jgi:diguanylate cyclase (GGDEF)-like protein
MMTARKLRHGILACFFLLLVILGAGTTALILSRRQEAMAEAATTIERVALLAESTANRQFLQVDGALASLPSMMASLPIGESAADPKLAERLLRSFNFQTFIFRDLMLLKPDGTPWATARPPSLAWISTAWSEQISTRLRVAALSITGPIRNPITGDWDLFFARPVNIPRVGRIQAVAEVPLPLLAALLAPVADVPGIRLNLERRNGDILATLPHDEVRVGRTLSPAISSIKADGRALELPATAGYPARIVVARRTLYDDVYISAEIDTAVALAGWSLDRNRLILAASASGLLISALGLALAAGLRQRDRADAERSRSRAMLENAIESMPDGFVMWDAEDRLVTCNSRFRAQYPISAPFIQPGAHFADIIREGAERGEYPQAFGDVETFVKKTITWHLGNNPPMERPLSGGRWVKITETRTPDGGIVGIRTDITASKRTLQDLADAHRQVHAAMAEVQTQNRALQDRDEAIHKKNTLFTTALNNMSQGLCMTDAGQHLIVCNQRFLDLFGLRADAVEPGMTMASLFHQISTQGALTTTTVEGIHLEQQVLAAARRAGTFLMGKDQDKAIFVAQRPMVDGGWVATYEDVTEQQRSEAQIRFMAHHDALTKLPNRVMFRTRMDEVLRDLGTKTKGLALLCLDLDKFKNVNDTLGHPVGDALLEAVGRRLRHCVRDTDVVARLGGDEFAIIQVSQGQADEARDLGERIIRSLSEFYQLDGRTVVVGASVGIALATEAGADADTLMKNADLALYRAKAEGRGTCCFFEADMDLKIQTRLATEADLRSALAQGQFQVHYQPVVDAMSERLTGFEALLRWFHPQRGLIPPAQFIPLAEELGLINSIGTWVLEQACADAALLPDHLRMAVNLSPVQLRDARIIGTVKEALACANLDPRRLELEITETALLQNNEQTVEYLHHLRELGLSISLDDFGTGFSSLSYLRSFPFDKIKIDRSFVAEIGKRDDCRVIVKSVASLAKDLGMAAIAEGVETSDQLRLVKEAGCTEVQGHYFGAAKTLEKVMADIEATELTTASQDRSIWPHAADLPR